MLLILPAEHKVDWRRPPIFTLALIAICILVFVLYQSDDSERFDAALKAYTEADLHRLEGPEYDTYLLRRIRVDKAPLEPLREEIAPLIEQEDWVQLAPVMLTDLAFVRYLEANGERFWAPETYARWQTERAALNTNHVEHLSSLAAGLIPAHIQIADLFSYQFLHGGWGHLIGNMVFLFLLGYALERVLGGLWLLALFLSTGVLAGLFFAALTSGSWVPLVGASGSISGLMGVYAGLYRLRRIRFFYMLGPYFNYFTAPALLIFPIWLATEIWHYLTDATSQIAYMAHAGGLLAGLLASLYFTHIKPREVPKAQEEDEAEQLLRKELSYALDALSEARFNQALDRLWNLYKRVPSLPQLEKPLSTLLANRRQDPRYGAWLQSQLTLKIRSGQLAETLKLLSQQVREDADTARPMILQTFNKALAEGDVQQAEKAFALLAEAHPSPMVMEEAAQALIVRMRDMGLGMKASQYEKRLADWLDQHG